MIKDIPTQEDFDSAAKSQFDFAWDIVISFLLSIEDARGYTSLDEDDEKSFWEAARQKILTALIITMQGVELAIKGKIVAISPFLLISGSRNEWPKDDKGEGVSFSDLRAIDAQDLIKTHDTACETKFDPEFPVLFESLRKLRNKAMHTVDKNLDVSAKEVLTKILEFHKHLYGDENWVETRRDFLYNSSHAQVYFDTEHVEGLIAKEFLNVFNFLEPSQVNKFFNINKKQRLYICPKCKYEADRFEIIETRYAVLRPNDSASEELYCFVCDELHHVEREDCRQNSCPGNVLNVEYDICCTCGSNLS